MRRYHPTLLLLAAIAAANLAPAAHAAGRPPRDGSVACAHTENTYCVSAGKSDRADRNDAWGSRSGHQNLHV